MRNLHITVNNKIATYLTRDGSIVCGNSDYRIVFSFDSEWEAYTDKIARFIWNESYIDVAFTGDTVAVPVLTDTTSLKVGVYAGELSTTTPAEIECQLSILCESGASEVDYQDVDGKIEYRLPFPTSTDEGKFLRVVNGKWAAVVIDSAEGASF